MVGPLIHLDKREWRIWSWALQGFHIKQQELICYKLILNVQGIRLLFNKDSSTIISNWCFSLSFAEKCEKESWTIVLFIIIILNFILISLGFI
jgi:hypothetical protein